MMTHCCWGKSWAIARALKVVLILFEVISYLKVNFHNNMLVGVNASDSRLNEEALVLNCKTKNISFM